MPIQFDAENRVFKLDSASTSYLLQIGPFDYLLHLYYGAKIPDKIGRASCRERV